VQVLADLVDDLHVFGDGDRGVGGKDPAVLERSGHRDQPRGLELERLGALGVKIAGSVGELVPRGGPAVDHDAAAAERNLESRRGELGGIFDGQADMEAFRRHGAPGAHHAVAGPAFEAGVGGVALGGGGHGAVKGVVIDIGIPGGQGCRRRGPAVRVWVGGDR
jgi:hypothetical protein